MTLLDPSVEYVGPDMTFKQPSIYKGETTLIEFNVDGPNGKSICVGKLWGTNGVLSFEGDADESARAFFNAFADYIKKELTPPESPESPE